MTKDSENEVGLREIPAGEIWDKIQKGEDIELDGYYIIGCWKRDYNLKIIASRISLKNCRFKEHPNVKYAGTVLFREVKYPNRNFLYFSHINFEKPIDFSGSHFELNAYFDGSHFNRNANFQGSNFEGYANFQESHFEENANFRYATFHREACFQRSHFNRNANFQRSHFKGFAARFGESHFERNASFQGSHFSGEAFFGSHFSGEAYFQKSHFEGYTDFFGSQFERNANFRGSHIYGGNQLEALVTLLEKGAIGLNPIDLSELINLLENGSIDALKALGMLRDPRAIDPLIEALRDESPLVRSAAAEELGKFKDKRAVNPLIELLRNEYYNASSQPYVKSEAAKALGELKDSRAVGPLISALKDNLYLDNNGCRYFVKGYAADALGNLGDIRAIEPLAEALKDEDVRWEVSEALENLFKIAIEINSQDAKTWYLRGVALCYDIRGGHSGNKYEEAARYFDKAIEIDPQFADAWYNKGITLENQNKYDDAIRAYDEAIRLNPGDHDAAVRKAEDVRWLGRVKEKKLPLHIPYARINLSNPKELRDIKVNSISRGEVVRAKNWWRFWR